ncbi:hypothetical protein SCHPADRAFT_946282 [Schizopora paradoxa]|uniref:Uncharacterized protein n=1 Tax=Schizopora paradoxa TaxID=27342 RepID=A0A0H2R4F1_9AGAM|nr:hypothetical protein SCHPADRAFT_946282 [Schizopora paradoxa]
MSANAFPSIKPHYEDSDSESSSSSPARHRRSRQQGNETPKKPDDRALASSKNSGHSKNSSQTSLTLTGRDTHTIVLSMMEKLMEMNRDLQSELDEVKSRLRAAGGQEPESPNKSKEKKYSSLKKDLDNLKKSIRSNDRDRNHR